MKQKLMELIQKIKEKHLTAKFSMVKDYIFAIIKIMIGIFTSSFFFCISGIYSIFIGLARSTYLQGVNNNEMTIQKEYQYYLKIALCILLGSIVYVIYMARLFFAPSTFNYTLIPSLAIAFISFSELALSIRGMVKTQGVLQRGLRCLSLTSSCTALVLTQVAIMSFAHIGDASVYNAISGCAFGGICLIVGIGMIIRYIIYKKNASKHTFKMNTKIDM